MKYITKTTQFCHQVKLMHFNINLHLIPIDAGEEETHFGTKRDKNIQYVFTFFFLYDINIFFYEQILDSLFDHNL